MKKTLATLLCLVCCAFCLSAPAETMTLWNGVTFGMTEEEVAAAETLESLDGVTYGPGMILEIINSTVTYTFGDGRLTGALVEFPAKKSSTLIRGDYDTVHAALKQQYGKKLSSKESKAWGVHGAAWTLQQEAKERLKAMGGKSQHEEWMAETEDGRVLIEHFCVYVPGRTTGNRHIVEYVLVPAEQT